VRGANLPGLVLARRCLKEVGEGGVACREAGRVRKKTKKKRGGGATYQGWSWRTAVSRRWVRVVLPAENLEV